MKILIQLLMLLFITKLGYSQIWLSKSESERTQFNYKIDSKNLIKDDGSIDLAKCQEMLSLQVVTNGVSEDIMISGIYSVSDTAVVFEPYFEIDPTLEFQLNFGKDSIRFSPSSQRIGKFNNPSIVLKIFPLSNKISENILTFYVEFDHPMQPIETAYKFIDVINEQGDIILNMWRQRSFWLNGNKTLALMIHPGRVKHGIQSTGMLKSHFKVGEKITLIVNPGLYAQKGGVVVAPFQKEYNIVKSDHNLPKSLDKRIKAPKKGSSLSLVFNFSEAMDFGLIQKWIKVTQKDQTVKGVFDSEDDVYWNFTPEKPWSAGTVTVEIHSKVGDMCHNQTDRLFEVKNLSKIPKPSKTTHLIKIKE